jgi:hypothetical protein
MNENLQRILKDLGKAVFEAMSDSDDVNETVSRVRAEGYTLTMQFNCTKDSAVADGKPAEPSRLEPNFKIDGQDLSFLQSIGIDPTRRRPRRR